MTVCERIDTLLKERGMSRRQLAIKANIPPSSFQSAMQRNTTISLDMLFPISEVLEVDVEWLEKGWRYDDEIPAELKKKILEEQEQEWSERDKSLEDGIAFLPIILNWEKLSKSGKLEAIKRVNELVRLDEYKRTYQAEAQETPFDQQEATEPPAPAQPSTDTPNEEKPPEGQPGPKDGK